MIGVTQTMTERAAPPVEEEPKRYFLRLKKQNIQVDCTKIIEDLSIILNKYLTWNDLLSEDIKRWADNALDASEIENPQAAMRKVESDINDLFIKILVSSNLRIPLKEPILDGLWTWEKGELAEYCTKFRNSPLEGFPLNFPAMRPHRFCMEIMAWAKSLPIELFEAQTNRALVLSGAQGSAATRTIVPIQIDGRSNAEIELELDRQLTIYFECAKMADERLQVHRLCRPIKQATKEAKLSREEIEEYVRLEVARAARHAEQQKEEFIAQLNVVVDRNRSVVNILNSRIEDHQQEIRLAFEKLSYSEQRNALQAARIDRLNELYNQALGEIQNLRSQIPTGGGGGGCTLF
jgi:hypothetical protein